MSTRVVTAHIPIELAEQVDRIATRLNRPRGWVMKQALASWVALEEKRYQLTREGLTDVDTGQLPAVAINGQLASCCSGAGRGTGTSRRRPRSD